MIGHSLRPRDRSLYVEQVGPSLSGQGNTAYSNSGLNLVIPDFTVLGRPMHVRAWFVNLQFSASAIVSIAICDASSNAVAEIPVFAGVAFAELPPSLVSKRYPAGTGLVSGLRVRAKTNNAANTFGMLVQSGRVAWATVEEGP